MKIFQQRKREPHQGEEAKRTPSTQGLPVPNSRILDLDLRCNERQCRCGGYPEQADALQDCHGESIATVLYYKRFMEVKGGGNNDPSQTSNTQCFL